MMLTKSMNETKSKLVQKINLFEIDLAKQLDNENNLESLLFYVGNKKIR